MNELIEKEVCENENDFTAENLGVRVFGQININGINYSYRETGGGHGNRGVNIRPLGQAQGQQASSYWVTNFQHTNRYTNNPARFYQQLTQQIVAQALNPPQLPQQNLTVQTHALGQTELEFLGMVAMINEQQTESNISYSKDMDSFILEERLNFIESLELDFSILDKMPLRGENSPNAAVDSGSVISFAAGVKGLGRTDVLNSTLLAQLAANKKHDREKYPEQWYRFYSTVLENLGWVLQEFNFTKYNSSASSFKVDAVIIGILQSLITQNGLLIAKATLDALKSLDQGDKKLTIFEQNSHSLTKGNFQIAHCTEFKGLISMGLGCFYFDTKDRVTRILWQSFKSADTKMYQGSQTVTLNADTYSQVRSAVIKKLGDNASKFIADLDI